MNYIKQLTAVCVRFTEDDRLNASHISMYLALFQLWNVSRFNNLISINRMEVMKISKIGSKATYHKCLKELDYWGYIKYIPSHNPLKGSRIKMFIFETTAEPVEDQVLEPLAVQEEVPSIKSNKDTKQIKTKKTSFAKPQLEEIIQEMKNQEEAIKFFHYYESNGWKIGGRSPMKNWKSATKNWMLNAEKFNQKKPSTLNLNIDQNKEYDIPL